MLSILLPTAYFPPIIYFGLINGRQASIEIHETFPKQTYRNRSLIMTANGMLPLVIPVNKPSGNHTTTAEIRISYRQDWPNLHYRAIESAYRSSPYFDHYCERIRSMIFSGQVRLVEHNLRIIQGLAELLGLTVQASLTTHYDKHPADTEDFRTHRWFSRRPELASLPRYPQVFEHKFGFQSGLSILDLLFNFGPDCTNYIKSAMLNSRI